MADEQHDNKAKATKRRSGDKKKSNELTPVPEESFQRPQINKLNLPSTDAAPAGDLIVHEEAKSPVLGNRAVKGALTGKTDVSSPLLERKNPLLDQAKTPTTVKNSPAMGKRPAPSAKGGSSPRKTVEIRTPKTERRMAKEKGKETEVVETQNPVFNTKREDASYTATTSVHSSDSTVHIVDSSSTSNESSRTRMERMIKRSEERRAYPPGIETPRLRFTPEEDKGLHRPKLAQVGMDQLLNPAVQIATPRSRPKASVLYSCLPSHLEKDHNKTLNPNLTIWRPEADHNISKILSLIPFFNETPEELYKTMQSLSKTHRYFVEKKMDACSHGKRLMEPGESCNLHILVIQDGYKKACPQMNEWLRECFPCKAWDYLAKLQNPGPTGAAMEDMETINWFASRTKRLFDKPTGPSKNKNYYQTRNCPCCQHRNPIEVREYCEACGLHLSNDPLKECVVTFQIVNEQHKVIPVTLPHPFKPGQKLTITLTLIVKCRNRQKHDSHWWGLSKDNGFMKAYSEKAEYGFLTDCGTLFHYKCLYFLMAAIIQPNVAAATGRQRVMSPSHQDGSDEGLVSRFFRHVQRCDFELSFGATMGSFACFGFLPVLPGPCGFYRLDYLLACAPFYHDFLSMDVNDIGVIDANLMIAEDRVLSWACFFEPVVTDQTKDKDADCCVCLEQVTWDPASDALELEEKNEDGTTKRLEPKKRTSDITIPRDVQTVLAPEAIFYFECETLMMNFVKQRRRWLNGTACGYLWLMYKRPFYPINTPYRPPEEVKKEEKRVTQSIDYNSSEESREDQASPKKDGDIESDDEKGKDIEEINLDDEDKGSKGEHDIEEGPSAKHGNFASHLANRWRSLQENTVATGPAIQSEYNLPSSSTTMQWQWRIPWYRRIPIKILVSIQLWMTMWVYLAPAIFIIMFRYALTILAFNDALLSTYWWVAVLVMYLVFVYISTGHQFLSWIFYLATLFGMVIECLSIGGIGKSAYAYFAAQANKTANAQANAINGSGNGSTGDGNAFTDAPLWIIILPLAFIGVTMFMPVVASCLACPKLFTKFFRSSFWYIATSFIPYFLFLPTLIAVFGAFSLARMFDFSWGNRDSNGSTDKLGARLSELEQRAKFMSPLFVAMNVALVFIIGDFSNLSPVVLLVWSLLLFGPALINIILSFGYFLWWRITQPCNACC